MHDIVDLERRGVPGVFAASDQFIDAAVAQSKALGFEPERVFVPHPIQDRTDEEMEAMAEQAVESLLAAIQG